VRGEARTRADNQHVPDGNKLSPEDVGLTRKDIHEARMIRDAEQASPGIVRQTVDNAVAAGKEPSNAKVRRAVVETAGRFRASTFNKLIMN